MAVGAKQSGLGDQLYLQGYDLSGDIGSLGSVASPMSPLTVTGIDKSAVERIGGLRDGQMEFTAYFNDAVGAAHPRLSTLPSTDVIATYFRGTAIGNAGAGLVAKQVNYDAARGDDGALTFKVALNGAAYGINWGEQLTAGKATITSAGAQTSLDYGASVGTTAFGLQAFLQVFSFTGTSATVSIQSSTDNGAGDAFANVTGGVFTAATGITAERIVTGSTASVERYLRASVTGTFSNLVFAVLVCRNLVATSF